MTTRNLLPNRRASEIFELRHGGQNTPFTVSVSHYPGTNIVAEVFIAGGKTGSDFEAVARDGAILLSLALQHHVALETIKHAITRESNGEPSTIVGAVVDRLTEGKQA